MGSQSLYRFNLFVTFNGLTDFLGTFPTMQHICPHHPKFCITFVFHFFWVSQPSQEKLKTMVFQNFGGQIRCIMENVEVAYWLIHIVEGVSANSPVTENYWAPTLIDYARLFPVTAIVHCRQLIPASGPMILGTKIVHSDKHGSRLALSTTKQIFIFPHHFLVSLYFCCFSSSGTTTTFLFSLHDHHHQNNNFILCTKIQKLDSLQIAGKLVAMGKDKYVNNTII